MTVKGDIYIYMKHIRKERQMRKLGQNCFNRAGLGGGGLVNQLLIP